MSNYLPTLFGENLMDVFNDFDRDFFRGFRFPEHMLYGKNAPHMMKTDVRETEGGYEIDMDLPGFKKDEIALELSNGTLTVSTRKSLEKKDEDSNGKVLRQERYSGSMSRSFYVGDYITEEDVKARFEDGVLHLTVPKKDQKKVEEKKTILIEG
ncbi:MAG: Hsp20/alpha crystallin family protein [Clostridia bacterium]|nr:Hsp20/alpha crystallin family protein [Clostridia bacterium]